MISDLSRWVCQASFQSLGPFISTFGNPSCSGQCFKDESKSSEDKDRIRDDAVVEEEQRRPEDAPSDLSAPHSSARLESTLEGCAAETPGDSAGDRHVPVDSSLLCTLSSESPQEAASNESGKKPDTNSKSASQPDVGTSSPESTPLDQEMFNSFHFWRTPLPKIDLDKELQQDPKERLSPERTGDAPAVPVCTRFSQYHHGCPEGARRNDRKPRAAHG